MQAPAPASSLNRRDVAAALWSACRRPGPAPASASVSHADVLALAASVAERGLAGDDAGLSIRERTAVRLLERGRPRVAADVARREVDARPFLTTEREGRVYVWLPGFGDPRADVPDDVYDVSDRILLRRAVDEVRWQDGSAVVGGFAHFSHLVAGPEDRVTVVLRGGDDRVERIPARRRRRPDRVTGAGQNLTRLAWSGFSAALDARVLRSAPAGWALEVEVSRGGLTRSGPLAPPPASALAALLPFDLREGRGALRVGVDDRRRLAIGPPPPAPPRPRSRPARAAGRLLRAGR